MPDWRDEIKRRVAMLLDHPRIARAIEAADESFPWGPRSPEDHVAAVVAERLDLARTVLETAVAMASGINPALLDLNDAELAGEIVCAQDVPEALAPAHRHVESEQPTEDAE